LASGAPEFCLWRASHFPAHSIEDKWLRAYRRVSENWYLGKQEASDYQSQKDNRWALVALASTRDLSTIAFFRAGPLLRRNGPVPGILAAYRPEAIMDKSGRHLQQPKGPISSDDMQPIPLEQRKRN
jgi:hypothetical protein